MRILQEQFDLTDFFTRVEGAAERLLLLDYDGTLAPFQVRRDRAVIYPEVQEALVRLIAAGHTRVVIVSGRALADLRPLLTLDPLPELWGTHGFERLTPDGRVMQLPLPAEIGQRLAQAHALLAETRLRRRLELKPASVAVHWRGCTAAEIARIRTLIAEHWSPLVADERLRISEFDGGQELRVVGIDKGHAVRTLIAEHPQAAIAYLGDDLTDEDAFRGLHGHGLGVLVNENYRPTAAELWIKPPAELARFLRRWEDAATHR